MLQILALLFGLVSWSLLVYGIIFRKKATQQIRCRLQITSWILCAVSLYFPYLSQHLELMAKDYDSLIDCASTYHAMAATLLLITLLLQAILALLCRKIKNE